MGWKGEGIFVYLTEQQEGGSMFEPQKQRLAEVKKRVEGLRGYL